MSNQETARRRLDYRQRPALDRPSTIRAASRSTSAASFTESNDILVPGALKRCVEFFSSAATLPEEAKTQQQLDDEARAQDVRELIAQGPPRENAQEYAAVIREVLAHRVDELLKADSWIFESEKLEMRT